LLVQAVAWRSANAWNEGIIHDFVMLNALRGTNAAENAIAQAIHVPAASTEQTRPLSGGAATSRPAARSRLARSRSPDACNRATAHPLGDWVCGSP
jgi:hypothetical protein